MKWRILWISYIARLFLQVFAADQFLSRRWLSDGDDDDDHKDGRIVLDFSFMVGI